MSLFKNRRLDQAAKAFADVATAEQTLTMIQFLEGILAAKNEREVREQDAKRAYDAALAERFPSVAEVQSEVDGAPQA